MSISHHKQWEFFKEKFETGQLSHSYLLSGNNDIGKIDFAKLFIKFINCQSKINSQPCGKCSNCLAIENGNFPDLLYIKPEENGGIQIAKIREAQNFLNLKSYYGAFKSVIVQNAETMNWEAQSCFLKTLEEPKGQTLLFLISQKPEILLDTIKSRCQQIKFFGRPKITDEKLKKEEEILKELLKYCEADIVEKFKYAKSIDFEKTNLRDVIHPLEKYTRYLLFKKIVGKDEKGYFLNIKSRMDNYTVENLKKILELIEDIDKKIMESSINQKLALENLLLEL